MSKKRFDTHLFVTILLLTILVFIGGLFLGAKITEEKIEVITDSYERLTINTLSLDVQNLLLQEKICEIENIKSFTDELYAFSDRVAFMENNFGWDDPRVLLAKENFALLQIRHWLIMKKNAEACGDDRNFILYFYSNKGDCDRCKQQGTVLTSLRREHENVLVYYFDINIENPAIESLKEIYNISTPPAMIINEKGHTGFADLEGMRYLITSQGGILEE